MLTRVRSDCVLIGFCLGVKTFLKLDFSVNHDDDDDAGGLPQLLLSSISWVFSVVTTKYGLFSLNTNRQRTKRHVKSSRFFQSKKKNEAKTKRKFVVGNNF